SARTRSFMAAKASSEGMSAPSASAIRRARACHWGSLSCSGFQFSSMRSWVFIASILGPASFGGFKVCRATFIDIIFEEFAQLAPSLEDVELHGALRTIQLRGDLLDRPPLDIEQHDGGSLFR